MNEQPGGAAPQGERLIRRALARDPDNPTRLVLVAALAERGALGAAEREARRAVIADRQRAPHARAAHRALLDHLCGQPRPARIAAALAPACHGAADALANLRRGAPSATRPAIVGAGVTIVPPPRRP